jgi:hypothetical protein
MSSSVSTFALGPVLFVTVIAVAAAVVLVRVGRPPQPATRPIRTGRGRVSRRDLQRALLMATATEAERQTRRRTRDWLVGAFARRDPEPAVTGEAAKLKWWQRLRSGLLLLALLVLLGVALAAAIGAIIFLAGFVLELTTK